MLKHGQLGNSSGETRMQRWRPRCKLELLIGNRHQEKRRYRYRFLVFGYILLQRCVVWLVSFIVPYRPWILMCDFAPVDIDVRCCRYCALGCKREVVVIRGRHWVARGWRNTKTSQMIASGRACMLSISLFLFKGCLRVSSCALPHPYILAGIYFFFLSFFFS